MVNNENHFAVGDNINATAFSSDCLQGNFSRLRD